MAVTAPLTPAPPDAARRGFLVAALWTAVFTQLLVGGFVAASGTGRVVQIPAVAAQAATPLGPQPLPPLPQVRPVGLTVPAIGVAENQLVDLAKLPTGELEVPVDFARVGWFVGGAAPGAPGPAVVAGHVDSRAGPAVFFRLRELRAGDAIEVPLSDGTVASFVVDTVEQHAKDAFPTAAVYGPVPGSALRLITCGGTFDYAARSYRDNIVVYASAAADRT